MSWAWSFYHAQSRVWPPDGYPPTPMVGKEQDLEVARSLKTRIDTVYTTRETGEGAWAYFYVVNNPYSWMIRAALQSNAPDEFIKNLYHTMCFSLATVKGGGSVKTMKAVSDVQEYYDLPLIFGQEDNTNRGVKLFLEKLVYYVSRITDVQEIRSVFEVIYVWGLNSYQAEQQFKSRHLQAGLVQRMRDPQSFFSSWQTLLAYIEAQGLWSRSFRSDLVPLVQRYAFLAKRIIEAKAYPINVDSTHYKKIVAWPGGLHSNADLDDLYFLNFAWKLMSSVLPGVMQGFLNDRYASSILNVFQKNFVNAAQVINDTQRNLDLNSFLIRSVLGIVSFGVSEIGYAIDAGLTGGEFRNSLSSTDQQNNYLNFVSSVAMIRHLFDTPGKPDLSRGTGPGMNSLVDLLTPSELYSLTRMLEPILQNKLTEVESVTAVSIPQDTAALQQFAETLRLLLEVVDEDYLVYRDLISFIPLNLIDSDLINESTTANQLRNLVDTAEILRTIDEDVGLALLLLTPVVAVEMAPMFFQKLIAPLIFKATNHVIGSIMASGRGLTGAAAVAGASTQRLGTISLFSHYTASTIETGTNRTVAALARFGNAIKPFMNIFNTAMLAVTGIFMAVDIVSMVTTQQEERQKEKTFGQLLSSLDAYMRQSQEQEERLYGIRSKILRSMNNSEKKSWNNFYNMMTDSGNEADVLLFYCVMTNSGLRPSFIEILANATVSRDIDLYELSTWRYICSQIDPSLDPTDEEAYREFLVTNYEEIMNSINLDAFIDKYRQEHNVKAVKSTSKDPSEYREMLQTAYMEKSLVILPSSWPSMTYLEKMAYYSLN